MDLSIPFVLYMDGKVFKSLKSKACAFNCFNRIVSKYPHSFIELWLGGYSGSCIITNQQIFMEIKVYKDFKDIDRGKQIFCARIECPDTFSFEKAVSVFKSIFPNCVVIVMAV